MIEFILHIWNQRKTRAIYFVEAYFFILAGDCAKPAVHMIRMIRAENRALPNALTEYFFSHRESVFIFCINLYIYIKPSCYLNDSI